jgi:hypothetical protein
LGFVLMGVICIFCDLALRAVICTSRILSCCVHWVRCVYCVAIGKGRQLSNMSRFHQPNEPKKLNKRNERYSLRTLTPFYAGRPGSWEAMMLPSAHSCRPPSNPRITLVSPSDPQILFDVLCLA